MTKGKRFANHRYRVNQFKRKYPEHRISILNFNNSETNKQIVELFFVWVLKKSIPMDKAEHELKALERLLGAVQRLDIVGMGISIHDKLVSFTIKQLLENNYAINHFDKNDLSFVGVSPYMRQVSAKFLYDKG